MTSPQFEALSMLFTSGHKPEIWGSDEAGWRIGPLYVVKPETKRSLQHQGWITNLRARIVEGKTTEWFGATDEGRRAFIAAGGDPGEHGRSRKARQRRRR